MRGNLINTIKEELMRRTSPLQCNAELCAHGLILSTVLLVGFFPASATGEDLPREAVLPLSLATTAAKAAVDQCAKDGYRVSAAVVDRAGVLRAFLRADGAGPHTVKQWKESLYRREPAWADRQSG